ncbi:hypothetical protein G3479_04925 [Shewanella baltica]|uniref:hypothetical protein n=1 Tax=Shewanella baltica TaxID=62322 RepID=UPI00217F0844|nr:hypothetical protein [Shewanella baltica]MCS6258606.1 hypothetical protein [Shewanella baltica]
MFEEFIQGQPTVFTSNSLQNTQLIAQLIVDENSGNHSVSITSPSPLMCGSNICSIDLTFHDNDINLELSVNVNSSSIVEVKGLLSQMSYSTLNYRVNKFLYILPNSGDRNFVHNNLSWVSTLNCTFNMYKDSVEVLLPQTVCLNDSQYLELNNHVDEQIKILGTMLTFCRSTTVEWESRYSFYEDNKVAFEYIKSRSNEKFSNQINPLRRDEASWKEFILHCMTSNLTMKKLLDLGVYQAIGNLRMTPIIDEWSLIRLVAALEGLVLPQETVIPEAHWKRLRRDFVRQVEISLSLNTRQEIIDCIITNINNSDRTINQQSLKNRIKHSMEVLHLASYYEREEKSINKIINSRNRVVHTGWDRDLDEPIWDMIVAMRNANYLLVMSKLNYRGVFWFCFDEQKQTVENYV